MTNRVMVFSAFLTYSLGFIGIVKGETAHPVLWYGGFQLYGALKGGKAPEAIDDVQKQFKSKWDDPPVTVYNTDGKKVGEVNNCEEFFKAYYKKWEPMSTIDRGPYGLTGLYCFASREILNAKPSLKSFISKLKMDRNIARLLPAEVGMIISRDDERKLANHKNWSWAKFDQIRGGSGKGYEVKLDSSYAVHFVDKVATGDFNGDGVEDIMLLIRHGVKQGTYASFDLFICTRNKTLGPLSVLKKYDGFYPATEDRQTK